jgi:hypothetical protein
MFVLPANGSPTTTPRMGLSRARYRRARGPAGVRDECRRSDKGWEQQAKAGRFRAHGLMSEIGPSRHFMATKQFGRCQRHNR